MMGGFTGAMLQLLRQSWDMRLDRLERYLSEWQSRETKKNKRSRRPIFAQYIP